MRLSMTEVLECCHVQERTDITQLVDVQFAERCFLRAQGFFE